MTKPSSDPSISKEPHLTGQGFRPDPSERKADRVLSGAARADQTDDEKIEHTVWDEPGASPDLAGTAPPGALTYEMWLESRRKDIGPAVSWGLTVLLALAAGPWAILGAFYGQGQTIFSILAIVVFAPVVEETMKAAAALYVVEKRPFLFRSVVQIPLCVVVGALVFASVENFLYLKIYIPHASALLIHWRWTVCVALHTGCSFITSLGLMRMWRDVWQRRARPKVSLGYPYLLTAVLLHGVYNAFAVALAVAKFRF